MGLGPGGVLAPLEVRLRDGAVVDPEDPLHDVREVGRDGEGAGPSAVRPAVVLVVLDRRPERLRERRRRPRQEDAPAGRAGLDHDQPVGAGERFDPGEVGGVGPVRRGVLLPRQVVAVGRQGGRVEAARRVALEGGPRADPHGDLEPLVGGRGADRPRPAEGGPVATPDGLPALTRRHGQSLLSRSPTWSSRRAGREAAGGTLTR